MPIEVIWDNEEKTIIRHRYHGLWTWPEFEAAFTQAQAMMDTVAHKVNIIADIEESSPMPSGMITHVNKLRMMTRRHPNQGKTVVAGTTPFLNLINDFFQKMAPIPNFAIAPSLDAVRAMLFEVKE